MPRLKVRPCGGPAAMGSVRSVPHQQRSQLPDPQRASRQAYFWVGSLLQAVPTRALARCRRTQHCTGERTQRTAPTRQTSRRAAVTSRRGQGTNMPASAPAAGQTACQQRPGHQACMGVLALLPPAVLQREEATLKSCRSSAQAPPHAARCHPQITCRAAHERIQTHPAVRTHAHVRHLRRVWGALSRCRVSALGGRTGVPAQHLCGMTPPRCSPSLRCPSGMKR